MADSRVGERFTVKKEDQSVKNLRKIRVICSDPEATNSSSDEADSGDRSFTRRIVCEIVIGVTHEDEDEPLERDNSLDQNQTERKKLTGVRLRKWGKWASEIRDPFSRKRIWLGAFNTAEEASKSYMAKKQEFQARKSSQTRPKFDGPPVRRKKSARWRESVYEPVTKPEVQSGNCDNDPELKALQSMKKAFYVSPVGSDRSSPLDPLSGSDGDGGQTLSGIVEEENKPPWMGLGIDMPLIDNHGNLLGQFSGLDDDLKICS